LTERALQQVFKVQHDGRLLMPRGTERAAGLDGAHVNKPTDVAFAADSSIYVSDGYGNNRIAKFSADGKFLLDWGRKGQGPGEFDLPHNVAVDAQGLVYVADRSNSRIQVFDANGKFLRMWKSEELQFLALPHSQELAVRIENLNARIAPVGDVHKSLRIHGYVVRQIELARPLAFAPPIQ